MEARHFDARSRDPQARADSRTLNRPYVIGKPAPVASDATDLAYEVSALQKRVRHLLAIQQEIVKLTLATTEAHIIAQLLRSACESLGYERAIYFSVDRERGIEARSQIDAGSDVEASTVVPNLESNSPLLSALRGEESRDDASSNAALPLRDVRGAYALSPLRDGTRTVGILYVDGARSTRPLEADAALVSALTAVAAAAIGNSALLARVTDLAMLEPLTGLLNRRAMSERLALELELCRSNSTSLTYASIDVDDLKAINDSHGHAQGDATLKAVADSLVGSSRSGDLVGRMSGDEFVVILPGVDFELASSLVARLSKQLAESGLRCSIGAAVFPRDASDVANLTLRADRALYAAKAAGKNRYAFA